MVHRIRTDLATCHRWLHLFIRVAWLRKTGWRWAKRENFVVVGFISFLPSIFFHILLHLWFFASLISYTAISFSSVLSCLKQNPKIFVSALALAENERSWIFCFSHLARFSINGYLTFPQIWFNYEISPISSFSLFAHAFVIYFTPFFLGT